VLSVKKQTVRVITARVRLDVWTLCDRPGSNPTRLHALRLVHNERCEQLACRTPRERGD